MPQAQSATRTIIPGTLFPARSIANQTGVNQVILHACPGGLSGTGPGQVSILLWTGRQR